MTNEERMLEELESLQWLLGYVVKRIKSAEYVNALGALHDVERLIAASATKAMLSRVAH